MTHDEYDAFCAKLRESAAILRLMRAERIPDLPDEQRGAIEGAGEIVRRVPWRKRLGDDYLDWLGSCGR